MQTYRHSRLFTDRSLSLALTTYKNEKPHSMSVANIDELKELIKRFLIRRMDPAIPPVGSPLKHGVHLYIANLHNPVIVFTMTGASSC